MVNIREENKRMLRAVQGSLRKLASSPDSISWQRADKQDVWRRQVLGALGTVLPLIEDLVTVGHQQCAEHLTRQTVPDLMMV